MRASIPSVVLVAGPGRSGTSLFTGLLGCLGHWVPMPVVEAGQSNPRGFSEPRWAVDFHTKLLDRAKVATDDSRPEAWAKTAEVGAAVESHDELLRWLREQLGRSPRVVIKDPRLGWFLDLYRRVLAELGVQPSVVTLLREPAHVLRSRELAYGTKTTASVRALGWTNMMLGVEERTRDIPSVVVRYADLLADWRTALDLAGKGLDVDLTAGADPAGLSAADALVDPGLLRSAADWEDLELIDRVAEITEGVYDAYGGLVGAPDPTARQAGQTTLDQWRRAHANYFEESWEVVTHRRIRALRRARRVAVKEERARVAAQTPPSRRRRVAGRRRTG